MTRRFQINGSDISGTIATVSGGDARHMFNVLRLKPGEEIRLFDGTGLEYEAVITSISSRSAVLEITERFSSKTESPLKINVAQGFLKDKKMDILVRHLTELGITRWAPFTADRSIPTPDPKRLAKRIERWRKISKEALKQCRRGVEMEICSPLTLDGVLEWGKTCDLKIIFWEEAGVPLTRELSPAGGEREILIVLGPEGGLSSREVEKAREAGFVSCTLGPRILRAETASLSACTLVQYLFGDMCRQKENSA